MSDLSGRPLLGTTPDAGLYVDRPIDRELERNARAGVNTLLVGDRGAGKTSALRQLVRRVRDQQDTWAVFVDGNLLGPSPLDLLHSIMDAMGSAPGVSERLRRGMLEALGPSTGRENAMLVEAVRALPQLAPEDKRVLAVVDSLNSPEAAHTLFGRLRDELWQTPYRFVASADSSVAAQMLRPPADAFFEEVLNLEPLTKEEQFEIAERRLGRTKAALLRGRLEKVDATTPRQLIHALRRLQEGGKDADLFTTALEARNRKLRELGRPAAMLVAELETLGARSASDEELLRRLGWSRQRAAQVFAQLERAGLVRGSRQSGSTGRPRLVFSLTEPPAEVDA